jgi:thiol:disulfide interchange protein DsbC
MKLPSFFNRAAPSVDGIHYLGRQRGARVLQRVAGNTSEVRVVPDGADLQISRMLDGNRSVLKVTFGGAAPTAWEHLPGSEDACKASFHALTKGLGRSSGWWRTVVIAALMGAFAMLMLMPIDRSQQAVAGARASSDNTEPSAAARPPAQRLADADLARLASAKGLSVRKEGKPFIVFSDPLCPYCQNLEKSLANLDERLRPVILPLGYKPGARDLAASILCSPEPAKAWVESLTAGTAPSGQACDAGYAQVDQNMALFESLRLTSTPTMISPSGHLVVGAGSPEQIAAMMLQ